MRGWSAIMSARSSWRWPRPIRSIARESRLKRPFYAITGASGRRQRPGWNGLPLAASSLTWSIIPPTFAARFARLRREFRTLYFSAFQSHLWNLMLARWIERSTGPDQRVGIELKAGRFPFPRRLTSEQTRALGESPLPLPSSREPLPAGPLGEVIQEVLKEFQLEWTNLRVKHLKDVFFSKGSRACLTFPEQLELVTIDDALHPGRRGMQPVVRAAEGLVCHDHG